MRVCLFFSKVWIAVGDKAERASEAVGVEMLYGAFVFERSWMIGGEA